MKSRGFTLLEVMLSLALASLVLVALAAAIDIHLRLLDSGRTQVEEAQLARALLDQIADDLRSAVRFDPRAAEQAAASMEASDAGSEGSAEATGEETTGNETDVADADDSFGMDRIGDLAESCVPQSVPGLYGNGQQLQVDINRMPCIERGGSSVVFAGEEPSIDRLCNVRTVTYYVRADQQGAAATQTGDGLVRREQGRATAVWAESSFATVDASTDVEPLASEVATIQFNYFDGIEWCDTWDSIEQGGLPMAVEIAIGIVPERLRNKPSDERGEASLLVYRRTVRLPIAHVTAVEDVP